ncbi:microfibril-associated glycoprotein 4-like [Acropora millepora]|uniref:microfibril-associated glycoprotein 4-like n=1 Tax=Acropora millepora TaxID=45264 RepID=UPI001CF4C7A1|nr:microfibril-associated glycoprotein 4-like [Acropora millepora]
MSHFPAHFYNIGLALLALLFVNQITANKPRVNRASKIAPTTWPPANCYTMFFHAGSTKRIETLLMKMNKTLSQVESDIKTLKGTCCSTARKRNCAELYKAGERNSGVYTIDPDGLGPFDVFCDQKTAGGGWTVFQKRLDGSVNFYRGWSDYKRGFGNLNGEYWLGLDKIYRLTKLKNTLRVDLEDTKGKTAYAAYEMFAVANERAKYKLSLGKYSGTAGDSLSGHRGAPFSTKDSDNDSSSSSCAVIYKGAWWYKGCHNSNLNGIYHHGRHSSYADGVNWYHWKGHYYSAKKAEMKIRPAGF